MKHDKCAIKESSVQTRLTFCDSMQSVIEEDKASIKGIVEVTSDFDNYVMAKQGDYRYKGLTFNYCPFCGEAIRAKPADLLSTKP